eukprot:157129-Alexandrium_andersonii.AAC.1
MCIRDSVGGPRSAGRGQAPRRRRRSRPRAGALAKRQGARGRPAGRPEVGEGGAPSGARQWQQQQ